MRKRTFVCLPALTALLLAVATPLMAYEFPHADPYVATVIGTPKELQAELPPRIPVSERKLTVFPERKLPRVLWYSKQLQYSIAAQDRKAPLVFLIAGLGAGVNDPKLQSLQRAFFKAGFHVVSLPSPTHPNFIAAASASGIPGDPREDARDLHHVMGLICRELGEKMEVTGYHLAGYSLGATHAAFVAELDEQLGGFRFGRVVLINPPVSMYNSMHNLDEMIKKIPGGEEKFEQFFDEAFKAFSNIYQLNEPLSFSGNFLYRGRKPNDENLAALIGLSFRLAMANMAFTTDVFTNAGYIKPKNLELSTTDSLTDYFKVADLVRFSDYFRDILLPHLQEQAPGVTEEQVIGQLSINGIERFLRESRTVFLFHNADDLIMAPGEIDYLRGVFSARARIYPRGGHCGNIEHRENVADMLAVFKEAAPGEGEAAPATSGAACPVPQPAAGEAPSFTAPRPAAASELPAGEKKAKRPPTAQEKAEQESPQEIIPARRPAVKPGLSYVIDVYDPLETVNRALYRFNAALDYYLVLPVTRAYEFVTPLFVQDRVSNLFANVTEIRNLSNALLQLRPARTASIFTRFLINTTVGLGGLWDPATSLGFPSHLEDFGQTLGWYGIGPGPYIVLPLFGPSSLRDTAGLAADSTAQYFYLAQPTDMDENIEWGVAYEGMYLIDKRHTIPFRYYQTGSPFEYDLLRLLYVKKREIDVAQ